MTVLFRRIWVATAATLTVVLAVVLGSAQPAAASLGPVGEFHPTHYLGACVDVNGNDFAVNNARVHIYPCHGGLNQQWQFTYVGNGWFQIQSLWTYGCLHTTVTFQQFGLAYGTVSVLRQCNASANQQWRVRPAGGPANSLPAGQTAPVYQIQNRAMNTVSTVGQSVMWLRDTRLDMAPAYTGSDPYQHWNQRWDGDPLFWSYTCRAAGTC